MGRYLLGVLVVTAGLVALASVTRENRYSLQDSTPIGGTRLRETEAMTMYGRLHTLLRPLPTFDLPFSLN